MEDKPYKLYYEDYNKTMYMEVYDSFNGIFSDKHIEDMKKCDGIIFGRSFNQPINNIPPNIKSIQFGERFKQKVNNLPDSVKEISFSNNYNQKLDLLPESVEIIDLGYGYHQKLDNLPKGLIELNLTDYQLELSNLPFDALASNAKLGELCSRNLPEGLEKINVGALYNFPIDHFPKSLLTLEINLSNYKYDVKKHALKVLPNLVNVYNCYSPKYI